MLSSICLLFIALTARAQVTYTVSTDAETGDKLCIRTEGETNEIVAYLFCCANTGQLCASYTYEDDVCSATPKHSARDDLNYPETTDACCAAAKDDRSLAVACD